MSKKRFATVWLDGCPGCHMSFLDMDERLLTVAGMADLVYSPLVDAKEFPENVDVALVEGAVSSERRSAQNQDCPRAHEDPGLAGGLRGHGQRSGNAQSIRHQGGL
jgi:coenzyme F420-reducing hydrogenase gamma subunit